MGIGNGIWKCLTTCTEKGQHLWGKNKENKGQYNCHDNKKRKAVPKDLFCSPVILFPMEIATRGAPPAPASMANALISIKMGVNKPTPVRAEAPTPGKQGTAREDFNNSRNYV